MTKLVYMDDSGHLYGSLPSSIWMTRVIRYKEAFSPTNIYPSSFWLLCFIPTFITKTPTIPYQDAHYSLSEQGTSPYLSLAINYQLKIKRFLLSHLTLLFSIQSTFRERRFTIHLKYFLQIYPLKFGGFKKK